MKLTILLILINVAVFFYTASNLNYYVEEYGFRPSSFLSGKYYIIVTSLFLHANIIHIVSNMVFLFLLGPSVEKCAGGLRFLLVYFLGGMIANLAMFIPFLYSPNSVGIGASGSISALIGLGTFICPGKLVISQFLIPLPFVVVGAFYFLSNAMNLFTPSQIGYPVHVLGLIVGSIFGLMWSKNWIKGILIFIITLTLIISLPYILAIVLQGIPWKF
jgi:membrane associated rhomboid family serine protease